MNKIKGKLVKCIPVVIMLVMGTYMSKNGFMTDDMLVTFISIGAGMIYGLYGLKVPKEVEKAFPKSKIVNKEFVDEEDDEDKDEKAKEDIPDGC